MNPEQQRLLEKAERSLQAAIELNQKGFAEFAVSRGYYAMFYMATAFLEGEGLAYSKLQPLLLLLEKNLLEQKEFLVNFIVI
jgi:uncharacterized protein (UPF0332 family)